jgi:hypothetical protein
MGKPPTRCNDGTCVLSCLYPGWISWPYVCVPGQRVRSLSLALRAFAMETENSIDRDRKIAELEARVRKLEKAS